MALARCVVERLEECEGVLGERLVNVAHAVLLGVLEQILDARDSGTVTEGEPPCPVEGCLIVFASHVAPTDRARPTAP